MATDGAYLAKLPHRPRNFQSWTVTEGGPQSPLLPSPPPPPASPKDQTFCKVNPKSMTSLRSGKTKINAYRAILSKSKPRPNKPLRYDEKTPVISTIYSKSPEQLGASRDLHYPSHRGRDWGSTQGSSPHLQGYIPISAGIYPYPRSSRFPFPVNGNVLMVRQHRVASWTRTCILINGIKGV